MKHPKLIVGNWKMNPETVEEAKKIFTSIRKAADEQKRVTTVICPPALYLTDLTRLAKRSKRVYVGAQDVSHERKGAFTGEISPAMVGNVGVGYSIIGHSERRALGETDEIVNRKLHALLETNMKAILCVGEKTRDSEGAYLSFLKNQIKNSIARVEKRKLDRIIIAYEPVWAIGRKDFKAMDAHDIHETVIFIRKTLIEHYGSDMANFVPVLYGGSINLENARDILYRGEVAGLLVGRSSLVTKEFGEILRMANAA